nr:ATPase, T2SS/T4P/T4SS family [Halosimplex aquaticum]
MPFISFRDRPVSIDEGSREVWLPHETGVSLTTRDHQDEYKRVTMTDLMTETNYLNPDVELIAEINTPESFETFAEVLNTGHGVIGTTHAADVETLVNRVVEQNVPTYLLDEIDLVVFHGTSAPRSGSSTLQNCWASPRTRQTCRRDGLRRGHQERTPRSRWRCRFRPATQSGAESTNCHLTTFPLRNILVPGIPGVGRVQRRVAVSGIWVWSSGSSNEVDGFVARRMGIFPVICGIVSSFALFV